MAAPKVSTAIKTAKKSLGTVYSILPVVTAKVKRYTSIAKKTVSKTVAKAKTTYSKAKKTLGGWFGW